MLIREVRAAEETCVKFVNGLLDGEEEDDEFWNCVDQASSLGPYPRQF